MTNYRESRAAVDSSYNPNRLFILSCISLVTAAFVLSLRTAIMEDIGRQFGLTAEEVGHIAGAATLGFALSVFMGSPLCDYLGMGRLLCAAAVLHVGGVLATVFSPGLTAGGISAGTLLWIAQFGVGLAHGLVEAVINPLCATIYPDNKTHKLNVLHAWWPGGMALGGLFALAVGNSIKNPISGLEPWQIKFSLVLLPAIVYGFMLLGQKFPPTERVASGVSTGEMFRHSLNPLFLLLLFCMLLTASLELGPAQWVDAMLSRTAHMQGMILVVYVSTIMFVFRFFAGELAHRLSPVGLMWVSSLLAGIGLFMLGGATSPVTAIIAATVWGFGVCYMWPTMLGIASERFPQTGAFGLGLIGTFGNLAINFVLPKMGQIYDAGTERNLPPGSQLKTMIEQAKNDPQIAATLDAARAAAAPEAFQTVAYLAVPLMIAFGLWWVMDRKKGGYKAIRLEQADPADFSAQAAADV